MKQSELDKKKLSQCTKLTITGIIVQSQLLASKQSPWIQSTREDQNVCVHPMGRLASRYGGGGGAKKGKEKDGARERRREVEKEGEARKEKKKERVLLKDQGGAVHCFLPHGVRMDAACICKQLWLSSFLVSTVSSSLFSPEVFSSSINTLFQTDVKYNGPRSYSTLNHFCLFSDPLSLSQTSSVPKPGRETRFKCPHKLTVEVLRGEGRYGLLFTSQDFII